MARSYRFAIIQLAPDDLRGEKLNIGAVILRKGGIDVRLARRLDKVRAISGTLETDTIQTLLRNMRTLDEESRERGTFDEVERFEALCRVGPLKLSQLGTFVADETSYEARIMSLLKMLVEPEPGSPRVRPKKTKLLAKVKGEFRQLRILAGKNEGLDSHRVIANYALDEGLVADLILQNGLFHIIETADASGDESALRKAISDIAVSALVLERARMRFGENRTVSRLVYAASAALEKMARPSLDATEHQGVELINWASEEDRSKFLDAIASMATAVGAGKRPPIVSPTGDLFH